MANQYRYKLSISFKFLIFGYINKPPFPLQQPPFKFKYHIRSPYSIIVILMSGQNIDYNVISKDQYKLTEGRIDSIYQKNSNGFKVEVQGKFEFEIRLKSKAIVTTIQVKPALGETLIIELIGEKDKVLETISHEIKKQYSPVLIEFPQSRERRLQTSRIRIEISNKSSKDLTFVGLVYLLVKGEKSVEQKQAKSISKKGDKKSDYFEDAAYSPHKIPVAMRNKEAAIFSDRRKTKPSNQKIEAELTKIDEEYNLKRAIQLSKKQHENDKIKHKIERENEDTINYYNKPRQYTKIDFEKNKKIFQYVTSKWVQAQRKIQIEKQIKPTERLSSAITVRHFHNKTICLDIAPPSKKIELTKLCEDMGANIKSDPCDHCLVIANRTDTECVAKARKMKNVKILRPEFVYECKQCEAYLDQKDYFHK